MTKKIGIFSGTFDPVHKGHIAFALKAAEAAGLDMVYFLPEAVPRRKDGVTHYAHRIALLRLATRPHKKLSVLDLPDKQFTVSRTLPRLRKRFPDSDLYLLIGSDIVPYLTDGSWPGAEKLIAGMRLVVGIRAGEDAQDIAARLQELVPDRSFHILEADNPHASSRDIRLAYEHGKSHDAALSSLDAYVKKHWLYVSVARKKS